MSGAPERTDAARAAFLAGLAVALSFLAARFVEAPGLVEPLWKAAGIIILGLSAALAGAVLAALALFASSAGDVFLELRPPHLVAGMAAFALAHLFYIAAFARRLGAGPLDRRGFAAAAAVAAISVMLRRPVKFVADRLESFLTDIHAREHRAKVRLACTKDGEILAFDLDDLTPIGPYSVYPRTSGIEGNQVVNLTGGPYRHQHYRARLNVVFTNKNVTCQYRGVGHPIAVAITEGIVDLAAAKIGMDPAEFRRRNLIPDDGYPYTSASGMKFEKLSHHQTLDRLLELMDYKKLRTEQAELRRQGVYRGIGLAAMIEVTSSQVARTKPPWPRLLV